MAWTKENRPAGKPWKKGQSGNPGGRPPLPKLGKALGVRLKDRLEANDGHLMEAIITKLIQKARKGDLRAAELVLQYTVGKPATTLNLNTTDAPKVADIDARIKQLLGPAAGATEPGAEAGDARPAGTPDKVN